MKKVVKVLILEPKPQLMEIIKKSIITKPDDEFDFRVVGTGITAKAGYYELHKHKPHLLFLDPELSDEDGLSFVGHVLERSPSLKIIGMSAKMHEAELLDSGMHAVVKVPFQKTNIWRKLDDLADELLRYGLLDGPDKESETEAENEDSSIELFSLDTTSEETFTPLFSDIVIKSKEELEAVEPSDREKMVILDDEVIEMTLETAPQQELSPEPVDMVLIEEDEPEQLDWDEKPSNQSIDKTEEPIEASPIERFTPVVDEETVELEQHEELETPEITVSKEPIVSPFIPHVIPTWSMDDYVSPSPVPLPNDESDMEEISTLSPSQPDSIEKSIPVFDFNPADSLIQEVTEDKEEAHIEELIDVPPIVIQEAEEKAVVQPLVEPVLPIPVEPIEDTYRPLIEDGPIVENLWEYNEIDTSEPFDDYLEPTENVDVEGVEEGSNHPKPSEPLYLEESEYNESSTIRKCTFEPGFTNRDGQFVPLYPPREKILATSNLAPEKEEVSKTEAAVPKVSPEGVFQTVKKLFKR